MLSSYTYSEAKEYSRKFDLELGFQIERVEQEILKNHPHTPWAGLEPQALQTPYPEIRTIIQTLELKEGQTIIDLGAGYGRMGYVIQEYFPELNFIGYEISPERVQEGKRIFTRVNLLQEDISRSDWKLPEADVYFIYDFGALESIVRVIDQIRKMAATRPIRVVGRGRRTRDHIERHEPWLSQVHPPLHCGNFSVYST